MKAVKTKKVGMLAKRATLSDNDEYIITERVPVEFSPQMVREPQGWTPTSFADPFSFEQESEEREIKKLPFPELPLDSLSPKLQRIVREVANGKAVPEEMILGILLALGSACIGRARGLIYNLSSGWTEFANLYILLIAETGTGKSHAYEYIFRHIKDIEAKLKAQWRIAQDKYEEDCVIFRKKKNSDNETPPKRPLNNQFLLDGSTIEAMIERLVDNPRGLFWSVDEYNGFFNGLDRYNKNGQGEGKRILLSAWDSKTISNTRKSKDGVANETYITRGTVGIFGGIQPHLMTKLFSEDDAEQGWPQRFLYIRAQVTKPMMLPLPNIHPDIDSYLKRITERLLDLKMPISNNGFPETIYIELSTDAHNLFNHFQNIFAKKSTGTKMAGYATKMYRITLRLALILHFMDWAIGDEPTYMQEISFETMESAISLMRYFTYHTDYMVYLMKNGSQANESLTPESVTGSRSNQKLIQLFQKYPEFAAEFHTAGEYAEKGNILNGDLTNIGVRTGIFLARIAKEGVLVEHQSVQNIGYYRALNPEQYGGYGGYGGCENNLHTATP